METVDLLSVITIAFLGSLGHCIGMCGGIVIAYSSTRMDAGWSRRKQSLAHVLYSLGRTLTYGVLGALFGYLGGVTTFSNIANGTLLIFAGLAMALTGLSLVGLLPFPKIFENPLSGNQWFGKTFGSLLKKQSLFSLFFLGILNGLLPCGFVYFFAITAASTGSPLWGAVVMLVFGLSTMPTLFSLGFFVGLIQKTKLRNNMMRVAALAVIIYAIFTMYSGYEYIVDQEKFILDCCS